MAASWWMPPAAKAATRRVMLACIATSWKAVNIEKSFSFPAKSKGKFPPRGDFHVIIHGILRLHGADHLVDLAVQGKRTPNGISAATDFVIPYAKWGVKNPSNFLLHVSNEVQIHIETTALASDVANPPALGNSRSALQKSRPN
jgi:hypothetical protein